jgi:hypothetical protein
VYHKHKKFNSGIAPLGGSVSGVWKALFIPWYDIVLPYVCFFFAQQAKLCLYQNWYDIIPSYYVFGVVCQVPFIPRGRHIVLSYNNILKLQPPPPTLTHRSRLPLNGLRQKLTQEPSGDEGGGYYIGRKWQIPHLRAFAFSLHRNKYR